MRECTKINILMIKCKTEKIHKILVINMVLLLFILSSELFLIFGELFNAFHIIILNTSVEHIGTRKSVFIIMNEHVCIRSI